MSNDATAANNATEANNATVTTETKKRSGTPEVRDTVYIGKKPLMAYVTSTLIQLSNIPCVAIRARGMSIGRAADVSQIISRKTENAGYTIGIIKLGSEALESQDGRTRNVSTIEIVVKRIYKYSLLVFFSFISCIAFLIFYILIILKYHLTDLNLQYSFLILQ